MEKKLIYEYPCILPNFGRIMGSQAAEIGRAFLAHPLQVSHFLHWQRIHTEVTERQSIKLCHVFESELHL